MKGAVWALVFLVILVSASAAFFPQPGVIFEFKGAECNNGTLFFNLTHEGNSIPFSSINFLLEGETLTQNLEGSWYIGGYPSSNYEFPADDYTGNDFFGKSRIRFKSTNSFYTKDKYTITMIWPSNSLYYDRIKFAVQCPAIQCANNDKCISQQACTNQTCEWIKCPEDKFATGHTCLPKCNDYDKCTNDYYVDGKCVYTNIVGCTKEEVVKETNIFAIIWNWLKSRYK